MQQNAYKVIGERIKIIRTEKKLTQKEFTEKLSCYSGDEKDLTRKYIISRVERGHQLPTTKMLINIANVFNKSVDNILFGKTNSEVNILSAINKNNNLNKYDKFIELCLKVAEDYKPIDDEHISENFIGVREIREENSIPIDILADSFGMSIKNMYRMENRSYLPPTSFLIDFCKLFKVSADYILFQCYYILPIELNDILVNFTYSTQKELMQKFISIAEKCSLL